jgi:hypothetical protein
MLDFIRRTNAVPSVSHRITSEQNRDSVNLFVGVLEIVYHSLGVQGLRRQTEALYASAFRRTNRNALLDKESSTPMCVTIDVVANICRTNAANKQSNELQSSPLVPGVLMTFSRLPLLA